LSPCRDAQAHPNLAVGYLARGARVLALHSHRVTSLLEESRIVDDRSFHWLPSGHRIERVLRDKTTNRAVAPRRIRAEMLQPLVRRIGLRRIGAGSAGHRLKALALAIAEQSHGVDRERRAPAFVSKDLADLVEILFKSPLSGRIHEIAHDHFRSW